MVTEELLTLLKQGIKARKTTAHITEPLLQAGYTLPEINDGLRQLGRDPLAVETQRASPNWILRVAAVCITLVIGYVLYLNIGLLVPHNVALQQGEPSPTQNVPVKCKTATINISPGGAYTVEGKTLSCFAQAAFTCEPALMTLTRRFADQTTNTVDIDMTRGEDGTCVLTFSGPTSHDTEGACRFQNPAHITAVFSRWENGKANLSGNLISEFNDAACEGSYFSGK